MKITSNWLKEHLDTKLDENQIIEKLTDVGLEVESVEKQGGELDEFIVAKILKAEKHPNADKLRVCDVDIGKENPVKVVCGAPNAIEGLLTIYAPPGAIIPKTKFKLKIANLIKDLDETRVNQEIALLALKHDVSEELDRIIFHTKSMNQELKKQSCSGKKIDFILQELFREANTLSVKLDDPNSKNLALDAKLLVEEMREQIQNVE